MKIDPSLRQVLNLNKVNKTPASECTRLIILAPISLGYSRGVKSIEGEFPLLVLNCDSKTVIKNSARGSLRSQTYCNLPILSRSSAT